MPHGGGCKQASRVKNSGMVVTVATQTRPTTQAPVTLSFKPIGRERLEGKFQRATQVRRAKCKQASNGRQNSDP